MAPSQSCSVLLSAGMLQLSLWRKSVAEAALVQLHRSRIAYRSQIGASLRRRSLFPLFRATQVRDGQTSCRGNKYVGGRGLHAACWHSCCALKFRVCLFIHVSVAMALRCCLLCWAELHRCYSSSNLTQYAYSRVCARLRKDGGRRTERSGAV